MSSLHDHMCSICNINYASRQSLCNHSRKFHRKNIPNNIKNAQNCSLNAQNSSLNAQNIQSKFNCKYCNKIFTKKYNLFRHYITCKNKINYDKKIEEENIQLKKENQKLQKITNNNITNNNNNKIINSDDNKFQFDLNKNFLTFNDKPIKYFYYNDQVYFRGGDIASMLDYSDTDQAIRKNVNKLDKIKIYQLLGGPVSETGPPKCTLLEREDPKTVFINESGFYSLILASKKDEAIKFKDWVTSKVLPSIRKTGSYNLIDNYIEEDLEKYQNKDCVYIINIKDNIYKYGYTSHIFKRLQTHKHKLNYNKIIKIYDMNNMNEAIKMENKIKRLVQALNINIIYNKHKEIFEADNANLLNLIKKIDELSIDIIKKNYIKFDEKNTKQLELEDKIKQLELEKEILELKLELAKLTRDKK
uniref:C2H2-type domain-containing protein n=1 Tax=viral metagenome TaxID=1070528 RepID=A0A6C0EDF1_9ZZZZ